MNRCVLILLPMIACLEIVHAEDPAVPLAPELAPLAAKYNADLTALETQKAAEVLRVSQPYLTALDAGETKATTAGEVKGMGAITQERTEVKGGEMREEEPAELPKGLHGARKSCMDGIARVTKDFTARQDKVKTEYVKALGALETRGRGNAALMAQIATEKERVVRDITPTSPAGILTSFLWVADTDIWEFAANGKLIQHRPAPPAWPGKSWKLASNRKGVECVFGNGKTGTYPFINGRLYHWDKKYGEFHREPLTK
jgi:hypothetical protein